MPSLSRVNASQQMRNCWPRQKRQPNESAGLETLYRERASQTETESESEREKEKKAHEMRTQMKNPAKKSEKLVAIIQCQSF